MTPEKNSLFGGETTPTNDALNEPTGGYGNQRQYVSKVLPAAEMRQREVEKELRHAFGRYIETRQIEVIVFERIPATDLARAILNHPLILKPLLAACNLAGRALKRDLKIDNIDTYEPTLTSAQANAVAGYLLSFLPQYIELPALSRIDRVSFIDKEIRKDKGRWEKLVCEALNLYGHGPFKKRKFEAGGQVFELDAATPAKGDVQIGIDIKRIEARQDIHKRCDEIVNKAAKLKAVFRKSKFGAVIYYPFIQEHPNVTSRLTSPNIDAVVFASGSAETIENAVRLLLAKVEGRKL
ncbi:MAG: hypothetical protein FJ398_27110 [Verrucomicrobia bacterium]|nr:hypothetical protein [Verrucomicrobiota bacterium]